MAISEARSNAEKRYKESVEHLSEFSKLRLKRGGVGFDEVLRAEASAALIAIVLVTLDEYSETAELDRAAAMKDRRDQRYNRWVIAFLTVGLVLTAIFGLSRPATPPTPVTLTPTLFVVTPAPKTGQ